MPSGSPYSVRWSGFVRPQYAQVYTFFAGVQTAVERMKLWVDNSLLVDQWTDLTATEKSGTLMIGTANGYYDVVMEYKQPSGTGVVQGAKLSWQGSNVPKSVIPASSLTQSSHVSASPFFLHHDDCWTAVGSSRGEVLGGMQITVVGHGFDNTGSSFYKCVFGQTPVQGHGPSGMKSGLNFLEGTNSSVESVSVFPISSNKIVCILPEWVQHGRSIAPSLSLLRINALNAKGANVPEYLCSGGHSNGFPCASICNFIGCGGCVGGVCSRNSDINERRSAVVRSIIREYHSFSYEPTLLGVFPRKRLLLGSSRILTLTGTGFDQSSSAKCEFVGGDIAGLKGFLASGTSWFGAQQTAESQASQPSSLSTFRCIVPSAYKGYGDASVSMKRATDSHVEPAVNGKTWFTFAGTPTITAIIPGFGPISGGSEITLYGANLGPAKIFVQARVGGTSAMVSDVPAYDSMKIRVPQGRGGNKKVELLVDGQVAVYSYFSYVASYILGLPMYDRHYNAPGTGSVSLTVAGLNFGNLDPTPRQRIDGSACEVTEWVADSTMRCKTAAGVGGTKYMTLTIDLQVAWTITEIISHDIPSLSVMRRTNRAGTGSASITVHGANFGHAAYTLIMRMGHTSTERTTWESDTSVRAMISHGVRGTRRLSITAGIQVGTVTQSFSIDKPSISILRRENNPGTGSASVTVHGTNMGLVTFTARSRQGHSGCEATEWESETSVRCMVTHGARGTRRLVMTVGERGGGSVTQGWSADVGALSVMRRQNRAGTGSASVTVHGASMGLELYFSRISK